LIRRSLVEFLEEAWAKMKSPPGEEVQRAFRISADIKGGG